MSEKNKKKVIDAINKNVVGVKASSGSNCIKVEIPDNGTEKLLPINGRYDDDYVDYVKTLLSWRTGTEKAPKKVDELEFI